MTDSRAPSSRPAEPMSADARRRRRSTCDLVDAHVHVWRWPISRGCTARWCRGSSEPTRRFAATTRSASISHDARARRHRRRGLRAAELADRALGRGGPTGSRACTSSTAGRTRSSARRTCSIAGARTVFERQRESSPLMRGTRLQLHWHADERFRFASAPDRMNDPVFRDNLARTRRSRLAVRASGLPRPDGRRRSARRAVPRTRPSCSSTPACSRAAIRLTSSRGAPG